jgi:hypothetical protein
MNHQNNTNGPRERGETSNPTDRVVAQLTAQEGKQNRNNRNMPEQTADITSPKNNSWVLNRIRLLGGISEVKLLLKSGLREVTPEGEYPCFVFRNPRAWEWPLYLVEREQVDLEEEVLVFDCYADRKINAQYLAERWHSFEFSIDFWVLDGSVGCNSLLRSPSVEQSNPMEAIPTCGNRFFVRDWFREA